MNQISLCKEIIATYQKYGWTLARVLLSAETRAAIGDAKENLFGTAKIKESTVDALWFSRPSHEGREAWELRFVAESPYALFETFEADEPEDLREDARREMEANLIERVGAGISPATFQD